VATSTETVDPPNSGIEASAKAFAGELSAAGLIGTLGLAVLLTLLTEEEPSGLAFGCTVIVFAAVYCAGRYVGRRSGADVSAPNVWSAPNSIAATAGLRARASQRARGANGAILLIFLCAAGGLYIFAHSEQLALDERSAKWRDQLRLARTDQLNSQYRLGEIERAGNVESGTLESIADSTAELRRENNRLNAAKASFEQAEAALAEYSKQDSSFKIWLIVSLGTLRLGSAALIIYLVQIFVGMYRYNTRMAAFYDARADALEMVGGTAHQADLAALVALLSADKLNFGREAKSPVEHATQLAGELVGAVKGEHQGPKAV